MAHLAEHHPPMLEILQVTILGSAANLLPVPGAVVVRLANLRKAGVRVTRGLNLTAIIGLTWVGAACVLGGHRRALSRISTSRSSRSAIGVGPARRRDRACSSRILDRGSPRRGRGRAARDRGRVRVDAGVSPVPDRVGVALQRLVRAVDHARDRGRERGRDRVPAGRSRRPRGDRGRCSPRSSGFPAAVGLVITAVDRIVNLIVLLAFAGVVTLVRAAPARAMASRRP